MMFKFLKSFFNNKEIFVVNTRSKEIHSTVLARKVCKIDKILPKNKLMVTNREATRLVNEEGYSYCYWCFESRK